MLLELTVTCRARFRLRRIDLEIFKLKWKIPAVIGWVAAVKILTKNSEGSKGRTAWDGACDAASAAWPSDSRPHRSLAEKIYPSGEKGRQTPSLAN